MESDILVSLPVCTAYDGRSQQMYLYSDEGGRDSNNGCDTCVRVRDRSIHPDRRNAPLP